MQNSTSIPVVLIHRGMADYVKIAIQQALKENPVILLGDTNPQIDHPDFEYVPYSQFQYGVDWFRQNYIHLNTTPPDYERFCYERWFILRNFMSERNIPATFYIDSDVLLFCNVTREWNNWSRYTMTLLHRTAAISSYMTLEGVTNFVKMVRYIYANPSSYEFAKIKSHFEIRQGAQLPGGVCDMTLFEWFHYHDDWGGGPGRVGEMMMTMPDSIACRYLTTFDHNINVTDNDYEMNNGIKHVIVIDDWGRKWPTVKNHKLNDFVRFNSLHFQGDAKRYMEKCYELCK